MTSFEAEEVDLSYQEVANFEGTFEDAVEAMKVLQPDLMSFNDWIAWRKTDGLRPTKRHGSERTTKSKEESLLWRRTMLFYYGDDWRRTLEANQIAIAEEELPLIHI